MKFKTFFFFLLICSTYTFSQNGKNGISKTFSKIINGTEDYRGGRLEYEAEIKYLAMNMGLGNAVLKVGIMSYTVENFHYRGKDFRFGAGYNFNFPIENAANQFRVSGYLLLDKFISGSGYDSYEFTIPMCQKGALDIYYFTDEEAEEIINSNFKHFLTKKNRMDDLRLNLSQIQIIPERIKIIDNYIATVDKNENNKETIRQLKNKINRSYSLNIAQIKENINIYRQLIKLDKQNNTEGHKSRLEKLQIRLKNLELDISENKKEFQKDKKEFAEKMKRADKKAEIESKRFMRKMRLEQTAYRKNISKHRALGFNEAEATAMVNLEKSYDKMEVAAKKIGNVLGNAIGNYFEKKEAKRSAREDARRLYLNSFHKFSKEVDKKNSEQIIKIKEIYFPEKHNPVSIRDQKQRILAFITMFGNINFPNEINRGATDLCIIKQKIKDAYFEEDKLYITFTHEILNSQFDKGSFWDDKFRMKKYVADYKGHYDYKAKRERVKVSVQYPDKRYPKSGDSYLVLANTYASGKKGYQDFYYKKRAFYNLKLPEEIHQYNKKLTETILDSIKKQSLIKKPFNNYVNDKKEGPWKIFDEDTSKIFSIGNFKKGEEEGLWKFYDDDGNLKSEITFSNGKMLGLTRSYYKNNKLESESTIVRDWKEGDTLAPYEGEYKSYNKQGILTSSFFYKNGKKDGVNMERKEITNKNYNNNNPFNIIVEKQYNNGKLHGLLRIYKEDKTPIEITNYKKNKRDGLQKTYFDNGKLSQKSYYKNGKLEGVSKNYGLTGNLRIIRTHSNGKPIGLWKFYNNDNKLQKTQEYIYNNSISKLILTIFYPNKNISEKIEYIIIEKNQKTYYLYYNILESYSTDGTERKKGTLKNGNGTVLKYDNNKVIGKIKYKNGVKK